MVEKTGTTAPNKLLGTAGDDVLIGLLGNDTITGGNGNDQIYGNDFFLPAPGLDNDVLHGGNGNDYIEAHGGNDIVYGEAGFDEVYGGFGNDLLFGGAEIDALHGNEGNDSLYGGADDDRLSGEAGRDLIDDRLGDNQITGENGVEGNLGPQSNYSDTITSGAGEDSIKGDNGNDFIKAGGGDDTVKGGSGADTIHLEGGNDVAYGFDDNWEHRSTALDGKNVIFGEAGNDSITAGDSFFFDLVTVRSDRVDNLLNGGDGDDYIVCGGKFCVASGGAGSDTIAFGDTEIVADSLAGGAGADTFTYINGAKYNGTRILNFQFGVDKIDLTFLGFQLSFEAIKFQAVANGIKVDLGAKGGFIVDGAHRADFHASDFEIL